MAGNKQKLIRVNSRESNLSSQAWPFSIDSNCLSAAKRHPLPAFGDMRKMEPRPYSGHDCPPEICEAKIWPDFDNISIAQFSGAVVSPSAGECY
jgi:hypothetical protein